MLAKRNHHKKWQGLTPNAVQSRHRCRWSCCVLSLLSPVLLLSGWIVYPPGLRCTLSETGQLAHIGYAPPVVRYCIKPPSKYPHILKTAVACRLFQSDELLREGLEYASIAEHRSEEACSAIAGALAIARHFATAATSLAIARNRASVCSLAFQQPLSASVCVCTHIYDCVCPCVVWGKGAEAKVVFKIHLYRSPDTP